MSGKTAFFRLCALCLCIAAIFLFSCAPSTANVPYLSDDTFTLQASGEFSGFSTAFTVEKQAQGNLRLTFTAPESIAGCTYTLTALPSNESPALFSLEASVIPTQIRMSLADLEIELSEGDLPASVLAMGMLFSFPQSDLVKAQNCAQGVETVFLCEDGEASLLFRADGVPLSASGTLYGIPFTLCFADYRPEEPHVQSQTS